MPELKTMGPARGALEETAHYFEGSNSRLYTVLHHTENPIARVLLLGPYASDRPYAYSAWVSWARYLAKRGVEVLRFDYRGTGESEGTFEDVSFADWKEDGMLLANWLRDRRPDLPLVLHGLQVGALLAAEAFEQGLGDTLFLWSPPPSANQALRQTLLRWVAVDQLFRVGKDRRSASTYIQELEEGRSVDVEGYRWSARLWHESKELRLPPSFEDRSRMRQAGQRPVLVVELGKDAVPLIKGGPAVAEEPRDFTALFARNWNSLLEVLPDAGGGKLAAGL